MRAFGCISLGSGSLGGVVVGGFLTPVSMGICCGGLSLAKQKQPEPDADGEDAGNDKEGSLVDVHVRALVTVSACNRGPRARHGSSVRFPSRHTGIRPGRADIAQVTDEGEECNA